MAEWLKSLIIGIIQGLTEYLPVSSSGHIELGQALIGHQIEDEATFSVLLHLATVLSTVVVCRRLIWEILVGIFRFDNNSLAFAAKVVISMVPAALVGVFLEDWLDQFFQGQILLVGCCLLLTAALLFFVRKNHQGREVGYFDAVVIGIAQMVAILPGVSRSGATISTAVVFCGVDNAKAAEFSFLMVIPLVLGKVAKDILGGDIALHTLDANMLIGFFAAFVVGVLACQWMLAMVKRGRLLYFSVYCALVGIAAIAVGLVK